MSVRIGFIGAGGITRPHLTNLMQIDSAEVVALCDLAPESIEQTQQAVNRNLDTSGSARRLEATIYTDLHAMLRKERLDAVYVCLPPFAHGEAEEAVVAADLPMLVEKPLALDLGIANRILDGVKQRKLLAVSGYQLRYGAHIQRAKEALQGRTIGMALVVRAGGAVKKPYYRFQDKTGGQLIEMATHQVDLLRELVGEVKSVYAEADLRVNHVRVGSDYEIFDVNCMTLRFENGAVGNFANSQILHHGTLPGINGLHILADGVTVSLGKNLRIQTADGIEEVPAEANPMFLEDQAFVHAVEQGRPELIRSDYANGVRTLAVTIAGERSARTGQPIRVRDLLADEAPTALPA